MQTTMVSYRPTSRIGAIGKIEPYEQKLKSKHVDSMKWIEMFDREHEPTETQVVKEDRGM